MTALNGINQVDLGAREQIEALKEKVGLERDGAIYGICADFENNTIERIGASIGMNGGDDFDGLGPWNRKRCNLTNDGVVLAYYGDENYTEFGKTLVEIKKDGIVYPIGTDVQVMVEQPKFYYRVEPLKLKNISISQRCLFVAPFYNGLNAVKETKISLKINSRYELSTTVMPGRNFYDAIEYLLTDLSYINIYEERVRVGHLINRENRGEAGGSGSFLIESINKLENTFSSIYISNPEGNPEFEEIPSFICNNYKESIGQGIQKCNYYITKHKKSNFKLHPTFVNDDGKEFDYIYLSAYKISKDLNSGRGISKKGEKYFAEYYGDSSQGLEKMIKLNSNNHYFYSINHYSLSALLFAIEYCSFNIKKEMGSTGDRNEFVGSTSILGNKTGEVISGEIIDKTYRGEENVYGDYTMLGGIKLFIDNGMVTFKISNKYNILDFSVLNYKINHYHIGGYVSLFTYLNDYDYLFLPIENNGNSNNLISSYVSLTEVKGLEFNKTRAMTTSSQAFLSLNYSSNYSTYGGRSVYAK